jgi:glycosyltransferase involved in cell wall biosynthesis
VNEKKLDAPAAPRPVRHGDTLIFLATYNERETITKIVDALLALSNQCDVLVVDDRSTDGTTDILTSRAAADRRVGVIVRPGKLGVGSAHKLGWLHARRLGYRRIAPPWMRIFRTTRPTCRACSRPSTAAPTWPSDRGSPQGANSITEAGACFSAAPPIISPVRCCACQSPNIRRRFVPPVRFRDRDHGTSKNPRLEILRGAFNLARQGKTDTGSPSGEQAGATVRYLPAYSDIGQETRPFIGP